MVLDVGSVVFKWNGKEFEKWRTYWSTLLNTYPIETNEHSYLAIDFSAHSISLFNEEKSLDLGGEK